MEVGVVEGGEKKKGKCGEFFVFGVRQVRWEGKLKCDVYRVQKTHMPLVY